MKKEDIEFNEKKKVYSKPSLTIFGLVKDITQTNLQSNMGDGMGGMGS